MIIAVPVEGAQVFGHFGQTENFKLYEVREGKIAASSIVSTGANRHGSLVEVLKKHNTTVLICGGIGGGAQNMLTENGIAFRGGVSGEADKAVSDYLTDSLDYDAAPECNHRHGNDEGDDHICTCH